LNLSPKIEKYAGHDDLRSLDAQVWATELDRPDESIDDYLRLLSGDEKQRARTFNFERERSRFIVARATLRKILGHYLAIPAERVEFRYLDSGKPVLADGLGYAVRFNVSHSAARAAFVVARRREVGIDIEQIRPIPDLHSVADRFFSAPEARLLRLLPQDRRAEAFFRCWTRKEAFVKAIGAGLAFPLSELEVLPCEQTKILKTYNGVPWSISDLSVAPGYLAALAIEEDGHPIGCTQGR
jgi:4'-phosphopantetheinyl transferase